jgi:hypothetical protein
MNTQALLLTVSLAAAGIGSAHAEHFRPSAAANGAVIGGIAGAFIGGHNNDRWGQGALIGAAAGALIGAAVDQPRQVVYTQPVIRPVTVVQSAPVACSTSAPVYVEAQPCAQPATQVVYVQPQPRVVYVQQPTRVVYVSQPQPRHAPVVVVNPQHRHRGRDREIVYVAPSHPRW